MSEVKTINHVTAIGRLIGINAKENQTSIILHSKNGRDIYPRFIVPPTISLADISIRSKIVVEGHIERTEKKYHDELIINQYFVADSIHEAKTLLETVLDEKGIFFEAPSVKIALCGEVITITDEEDWIRFSVKVDYDNDERKSTVVRVSMKKSDRLPVIERHDMVAMFCYLGTAKKVINGKTKYYEDIMCVDIAKL